MINVRLIRKQIIKLFTKKETRMLYKIKSSLILAAILILPGISGQAAKSPNWKYAYQFPHGAPGPLIINKGYAYILNGWTRGDLVQAYDIHNIKSPFYAGGIPGRGYPLQGVFSKNGKYLYISTWFSLMVIDVSKSSEMKTVRAMSFGFPYGDAGPITVFQDKLFMGGKRGGGIRIFDIKQPDAPLITAWYPKYGAVVNLLSSEKLLLIQPKRKALIICLLEGSKLTEVSSLKIPVRSSLLLKGNTLYCVYRNILHIYDLTIPSKPVEIKIGKIPALSIVGFINKQQILVKTNKNKLTVYELKNPLSPKRQREIKLDQENQLYGQVKIQGNQLFCIDTSKSALVSYDISGKVIKKLGLANYVRNECRLEIGEKYAWSFSRDKGTLRARATSLSKPGITPVVFSVDIGNIKKQNYMKVYDVFRAGAGKKIGDFLLMGDGLVDISNLQTPKIIKPASMPAISITIKNNLAFLAQGKQMTILDISKLPAIKTLATYIPAGKGNHIADIIVEDRYAYLINNASAGRKNPNDKIKPSLMIVDILNPEKPVLKGSCYISPCISGAKKGNYLYLGGLSRSDGAGDIEIIDISRPDSPKVIKHLDDDNLLATSSYRVKIRGNRLFLTDSMRGIKELDISNPLNPKYIRSYFGPTATSSSYTDFEFAGNKIYGQRYSQIDVWEIGK